MLRAVGRFGTVKLIQVMNDLLGLPSVNVEEAERVAASLPESSGDCPKRRNCNNCPISAFALICLVGIQIRSNFVKRFGYIGGVGEATLAAPRFNYTGDPYWTDGRRAIIDLSEQSVSPSQVRYLDWTEPETMQLDISQGPLTDGETHVRRLH